MVTSQIGGETRPMKVSSLRGLPDFVSIYFVMRAFHMAGAMAQKTAHDETNSNRVLLNDACAKESA